MALLLLRGVLWGAPTPGPSDPSRLIQTPAAKVALNGRLLSDVRRFPSGCSVLLEVDRVGAGRAKGRTELQLSDCSAPLLQGWRVQVTGLLRSPMRGPHPLLPGSAERLARQGSWSQLRVESIEVLQRPWTPLADLRRRVAQRLQQAAGPRQAASWPLWCWAAPRCSSPKTSGRRSVWLACPMPSPPRDSTSRCCWAVC